MGVAIRGKAISHCSIDALGKACCLGTVAGTCDLIDGEELEQSVNHLIEKVSASIR